MRHYMNIINVTENHMHGETKVSKDQANYTYDVEGSKICNNCEHFLLPNKCMIVEGHIEPDGWCKFFEPK